MMVLVMGESMEAKVMTQSMETKVMIPRGAKRMRMPSMEMPVMTNSMVIQMRTYVRTMIMSLCPALGVVTNFMATLVMTYFMVE